MTWTLAIFNHFSNLNQESQSEVCVHPTGSSELFWAFLTFLSSISEYAGGGGSEGKCKIGQQKIVDSTDDATQRVMAIKLTRSCWSMMHGPNLKQNV
jgi:hypothetical protein